MPSGERMSPIGGITLWSRSAKSALPHLDSFRKPAVGLHEALDQHAHEGLVEADLAGVGRRAQGLGLDLDDGDVAARSDGRGAPLCAVGEVEDLAEAAAGLDDVELLARERDVDLAGDEQEEALAVV